MKIKTTSLIAALLLAGPSFAQDAAPAVTEENAGEITVINGVPVNPELRERLMQSSEKRSVMELIELSNEVINQQKEDVSAAEAAANATGQEAWMNNPFGHLEGEMGEIVERIDTSDTGETTQQRGVEVVDKLDTLIALMEQACSACNSASSSGGAGQQPGSGMANGGQPAPDSTLAQGPGGSGDLRGDGAGNADIENLSDAQRDEILLSGQDGFPEGYEALLAEYYTRLATEASAPANDATPSE